jgi:signal transduction histidine kinase
LGLAIARELAEAMGGSVVFTGMPKGATFTLALPVIVKSRENAAIKSRENAAP